MAKKSGNNSNTGAIIAGLAGITAAAVGGYLLYGHKDADKNRAKVKGWMLKAKGEVLEELEQAGEVTENLYDKAVTAVASKYRELRNIDPEELEAFIGEMKDHWSGIKKTIQTRATATAHSTPAKKSPRGKKAKK